MSPKLCDKIALVINKFGQYVFCPLISGPSVQSCTQTSFQQSTSTLLQGKHKDKKEKQYSSVVSKKKSEITKSAFGIEGVWIGSDLSSNII